MIVCEYFFKAFDSRGSDDYFDAWAREVDLLGDQGWKVVDSLRQHGRPGNWTLVLGRPESEFSDKQIGWKFGEREE